MKKVLSAAIALLCGSVGTAHATTLGISKATLCQRASIVAIGKVTEVDSAWENTDHGYIITSDVTFQVERMIHGPNVAYLGVYALGGRISSLSLNVASTPVFKEDERYLLLLHPRQGQPAMIVGQGAGAVRLDPEWTLPSLQDLVDIYEENCDV